ncbi:antihemorrhagic factor cHLP-B-like [Neoarius graeffei]|uniref:antihemorrhagic factor cHLP-B-like n=1 Tax=Neoarius graeffei TaxID=443677 RepID=UPI00298D5D77|nr:antihemorrhagic factor cHLP-B-like [Neoarius graeffei]
MKQCVLLLLAFVCVHGAPAGVLPRSSCKDVTNVAEEAIDKINHDRTTGYVFSLERVSNVHQIQHGETGVVLYLTIDILETKCHVLSKKNYKECETRTIADNPVYGQCKAVVYVNRPHRVIRLYKYSCTVRPLSATTISKVCPDCPILISLDDTEVEKAVKIGLEKFNKESALPNYFAPLNITRAISQLGMIIMYNVEFTIQETVCSNKTDISEVSKCDLMTCEFAHKGFCTATHTRVNDEEFIESKCEIYEPEAAEDEKKHHFGKTDHHHKNTDGVLQSYSHDHTHDHTVPHSHPTTHDHDHNKDQGRHHTHEHNEGHDKSHFHTHSHEHSHDHEHVHVHHDQAHNHTQHQGIHPAHHNYGHAEGETHEHDHDLALDHEHKHGHLHEHEHHHHHHQHPLEITVRKPEGTVQVLSSLDRPVTLPIFPDQHEKPDMPTGLPLRPDPEIPGLFEPVIGKFPKTVSPDCPAEFKNNNKLIKDAFAEDPVFKVQPVS